ncbi:MAG: tetratricopeptide repeat protein [Candidatus Hydrogenedentes bacterium]|nr:tetratricopeptide repeat protein [Candidatus Hydrogenedentota bacterium]
MRIRVLAPRSLAAGLAVLLSISLLVGCSQTRSDQYRKEGDTYLGLGKVAEARASYEKSLAANADNAEAELGMGRCARLNQEYDPALEHYGRALTLNGKLEDGYIESLQILLVQAKLAEAYAILERFDSVNAEYAGILRAFLMINEGRIGEVVGHLNTMKTRFPNSSDVRVNLAMALLIQGHPEQAEAELQSVLETLDPASLAARMILIDLYTMQDKLDAYIAELEGQLKAEPENKEVLLSLARGLIQTDRKDEVNGLLTTVSHLKGDPGWGNYVQGCAALAEGQFTAATQFFQTAARLLPRQAAVAHKLSVAMHHGTLPASGALESTTAGAAPTDTAQAASRPAATTLDKNDWKDLWRQGAIGTLVEKYAAILAGGEEGVKEVLFSAAVFAGRGDLADSLLVEVNPDLQAFFPFVRDNNLQGMVEQFQKWQPAEDRMKVIRYNMLGYGLTKARARARGIQVLTQCLQEYPEEAVSLYNISQAFRRAQTPEFGARAVQKQISLYPSNTEAHTLLYITLREGGLLQEARLAAETSYTLFPDSADAIRNLSQSYLDDHNVALAEQVLKRGLESVSGDDSLKIAMGGVLLHQEKAADAAQMLSGVAEDSPLKGAANAYLLLATALAGRWEETLALGGAVPREMVAPAHRFMLAAAQAHGGNLEGARASLQMEGESEPAGGRMGLMLLAAMGQAVPLEGPETALATALGNSSGALVDFLVGAGCQATQLHDGAITALMRVDAQLGSNPLLLQMIFSSLALSPSRQDAPEQARALVSRMEGDATVWLLYANVLRQHKDGAGEREAISKALELNPNEPRAWFQWARLLEKTEGLEAATEAYRKLNELAPGDPVTQNNLAYCLLMSGANDAEALGLAQQAKEKMGMNPGVLHTLGVAQLRTGDLENSNSNLRAALEIRPGDPTLLLDYGKLLVTQGEAEEGKRHAALALEYSRIFGLDFPRQAEAEAIMAEAAPN